MAVFDTQSLPGWPEKAGWFRFEVEGTKLGAVARASFLFSLHGGIDAAK
jgi:hypothetical protein